jgi:uncharacterized protein (TIGR03089 family)
VSVTRDHSADVAALLRHLVATDPGRPRVTWYGPTGERVEFSAKTLDNWVAKTSNLLVDELDAGPGCRIGIDLPPHWRSVVWLLASWTVGAHAVVLRDPASNPAANAGAGASIDVLVTDRPSSPTAGTAQPLLVAVALPSLATRFLGELPPGAIDAATEVRLQPDAFHVSAQPAPSDPAFSANGRTVAYGDLLDQASTATPTDPATPADPATPDSSAGPASPTSPTSPASPASPIRLLTGAGPDRAIEAYLAPLAAGGSVVIHHRLPALTPPQLADLCTQEHITAIR